MSTETRKKRKKIKRRIRWARLLFVAILLSGGIWYAASGGVLPEIPFLKTFEPQRLLSIEREADAAELVVPRKGLAAYTAGTLTFYDLEGNAAWKKGLDLESPRLFANGSYLVLADVDKGEVWRANYEGQIVNHIEKDFPLGGVYQNLENFLLYFSREGNRLHVIDDKGKTITEITIPKGHILDAAISNDYSVIAVSALSIENEKYYSSILFYSLDGAVMAGNRYDGEIIFNVFFTREDELKALSNNGVFSMTRDGDVRWEKSFEKNLVRADWNDDGDIAMILEDASGASVYQGIDASGTCTEELPLDGGVLQLRLNERRIAVFLDRRVQIFNWKGRLEGEIEADFEIEGGGWLDEDRMVLIYGNRIEIIDLYR